MWLDRLARGDVDGGLGIVGRPIARYPVTRSRPGRRRCSGFASFVRLCNTLPPVADPATTRIPLAEATEAPALTVQLDGRQGPHRPAAGRWFPQRRRSLDLRTCSRPHQARCASAVDRPRFGRHVLPCVVDVCISEIAPGLPSGEATGWRSSLDRRPSRPERDGLEWRGRSSGEIGLLAAKSTPTVEMRRVVSPSEALGDDRRDRSVVGSRGLERSLCELDVLAFELGRGQVGERGVPAPRVVPALDVARRSRCAPRRGSATIAGRSSPS